MECVSPRHLPPASELPYLLTYSRPPSNTTGFHRATRLRSSSSRRRAPGDSHHTPLRRDGYHSSVSTETTGHYLPGTLCARAPTFSAEPPQVFPADSKIAATPSIAIWLGWLPRQRHRPIHATTPLTSRRQDTSPPRFLRTTGDPRGTFVLPVSPRYRQLPLRTPPLDRLPGDNTSSGTATASLTVYVATPTTRPSSLAPPRTQTTTGLSAFLDGTATAYLSNPSSPAPRRPALRRHRPSLAHLGSPLRRTICLLYTS